MTLRKISKEQPEKFEFTQENLDEANRIIKKYPKGRQQSAVMSLLYLAQNKMITGYRYQQ
jgi:NADH:ubiquinone oxidoreductase subunit E